jgi:CRP-like cAMP-binding protein
MTEKLPQALTAAREDILRIVDQISLFGGLEPAQLDRLLDLMGEVDYAANEQIFAIGDQPSHIYIVLEGRVRLDFGNPAHPLTDIHFDVGACFGETSVIGIQPHSASAISDASTRLVVLSRAALLNLFQSDTALFALLVLNIAREAARRLHATDQWCASNFKSG